MKLYIRGKCTICLGTNQTWYGRSCPYCDHDALQFFEASKMSVIRHILENSSKTEQEELITLLQNKLLEGEENDS